MTYRINDSMTAAVFIAGQDFPLDFGNSLRSLHLKASTLISIPELHLTIVDTLNQMPFFGLQDGAQLSLQINGQDSVTRHFRVYNWSRVPAAMGFVYTIDCYWDVPKYWVGTTNAGIEGTSSQVLQQIASGCGLNWSSNNKNTSDSMLWLPGNKTWAEFSKHTARRGYISDTSHMVLAVNSLGSMIYTDVNTLPKPKITVGYNPVSGATQFQMITDFTPHTESGAYNAIGGYRHSRYVQTIQDGSSVDQLEDELQFVPDAKYPLLSADVRSKMERGSISYGAIDFGNVHPNYERARYQNARYNLLNSLSGEFLFPFQTAWEPCDNLNLALPAELLSSQYDGEYTVQTKIIFIQGNTYNEQLIAVKNGLGI